MIQAVFYKEMCIQNLIPHTRTPEEPAPGETTLKSIIRSNRMDPGHSLKLWAQALKELEKNARTGKE
jgi:hypothetical protein